MTVKYKLQSFSPFFLIAFSCRRQITRPNRPIHVGIGLYFSVSILQIILFSAPGQLNSCHSIALVDFERMIIGLIAVSQWEIIAVDKSSERENKNIYVYWFLLLFSKYEFIQFFPPFLHVTTRSEEKLCHVTCMKPFEMNVRPLRSQKKHIFFRSTPSSSIIVCFPICLRPFALFSFPNVQHLIVDVMIKRIDFASSYYKWKSILCTEKLYWVMILIYVPSRTDSFRTVVCN